MFFFKKRAIEQLSTIALLWGCIFVLAWLLFTVNGGAANAPFPAKELTRFLDWRLILILPLAGAILFALFKAVGHRSTGDDHRRSDEYADLALDETGGALFHFGSLLFVCVFAGETNCWYIVLAVAMWCVGYILKPTFMPNRPAVTQATQQ